VQLSLVTATPSSFQTAAANVTNAITAFVGSLGIGDALTIARIAQLALDADPTVENATGISINGSGTDLVPPASSVIQLQSVSIV